MYCIRMYTHNNQRDNLLHTMHEQALAYKSQQ